MVACKDGDVEAVRFLLEKAVGLDVQDRSTTISVVLVEPTLRIRVCILTKYRTGSSVLSIRIFIGRRTLGFGSCRTARAPISVWFGN